MIEPEEVEEDDFDDEISEERLMLMEMRNEYKRKDCDSIGWTEDKKNFYIVMYQDTVQRSYYAKLDATTVRLMKGWCEAWLSRNERTIEGYV